MRHSHAPVAITALIVIATACTPETEAISTPAATSQPITDSAPYLCELVPERAFRLVSGATKPLVEKIEGDKAVGTCKVPDTTPRPLTVWWMREGPGMPLNHLERLLDDRRNIYTRAGGVVLPSSLGDGMAAYLTHGLLAEQPYRVSAKFRCGNRERLIDIYLAQTAKGRDAIKDLTDLMRIAQHRYADLHNCDLK